MGRVPQNGERFRKFSESICPARRLLRTGSHWYSLHHDLLDPLFTVFSVLNHQFEEKQFFENPSLMVPEIPADRIPAQQPRYD